MQNSKAARLIRILQATVLIIATLYFGRPILLPVVAAILITFLLSPPIRWLERRRVPRAAAVLAVVVLLFSLVGVIFWTATSQLSELVVQLPNYEQTLRMKLHDLRGSGSNTLRKVGESIGKLTNEIEKTVAETDDAAKSAQPSVLPAPTPVRIVTDPSTPLETVNIAFASLAGPLAAVGVLTVLVIFMSMVREDLRDCLVRLAGTNQVTLTTRALDELGTRISRYLLMNAMINGGFGLTLGIGLFAIGVQYAALWGLLATVLRFIPYLGVFIAAAGPIAITVVQFPGWSQLAMVFGLFVIVELLIDNIVEPLVYGRQRRRGAGGLVAGGDVLGMDLGCRRVSVVSSANRFIGGARKISTAAGTVVDFIRE